MYGISETGSLGVWALNVLNQPFLEALIIDTQLVHVSKRSKAVLYTTCMKGLSDIMAVKYVMRSVVLARTRMPWLR